MSNNNNKNVQPQPQPQPQPAMVKCKIVGSRVRAGKQEVFEPGDTVEFEKEEAQRLQKLGVVELPGKAKK